VNRIALVLEYDGSRYAGWQTQPHRRTVQDVLEHALESFAGVPLPTICAGHTDAGVHALQQVVHIDSPVERDEESWVRGVNRFLPEQVAVRSAHAVGEEFHARRGARSRRYDYWILNRRTRAPLLAGRAAWIFRPLDLSAMQEGARALLGTHDFSSFRSAECQAATADRTLLDCKVERVGSSLLRIRVRAHAFLHHMVRNMAGALLEVGAGREPASYIAALLAARDRTQGAATADAAGLYLSGVEYDPKFGLPPMDDGWMPW
jgi:tRNA pseudouridine38-40 synthase